MQHVFVVLSAAKRGKVNHKRLKSIISHITKDFKLAAIVEMLLSNRGFYVDFQGRWRNQRNGSLQGSVLPPSIYTNDQPIDSSTIHFIHVDQIAITAQ